MDNRLAILQPGDGGFSKEGSVIALLVRRVSEIVFRGGLIS
jgi:hypothetical protein